jgi:hypothetical protein
MATFSGRFSELATSPERELTPRDRSMTADNEWSDFQRPEQNLDFMYLLCEVMRYNST